MDDPSVFPRSVGEELFLVHLRRESESDEHGAGATSSAAAAAAGVAHGHGQGILKNPIAISAQRKREHTVGEELWLVHCKRSRGMTFDSDEDHHHEEEDEDGGSDHEKDGTHQPKSPTTSSASSSSKKRSKSRASMPRHCPYDLRSKDVAGKK
mmetsp:Transcript_35099/g.84932  ORF Transcript_35099/g.84932 Transcript_35099/m.84932 type:complete len:153 (-) Transcript_35099:388-846(-)|eukprot:CAMPEP_0113472904 /NCGR_PEP_ID=MMETSP0014_2-20120614/17762_1 /TAXON_ID=2857 /ORGANISM="Nitzschia sp." /LENGTH=152 /DNA_ID=CAMNT_0000365641 /DNA_START=257 /DNA_END=715 /DNA_ORIENTATION=+ /assembly_acc=CAM_ASM_000159